VFLGAAGYSAHRMARVVLERKTAVRRVCNARVVQGQRECPDSGVAITPIRIAVGVMMVRSRLDY
jgi:hypothetical protein